YYLDYPKQSMTQGFVIFPKKGETMLAGILKTAIDTLLVQVTSDNKKIDGTLTRYFRSEIGVSNTRLTESYRHLFPLPDQLIPAPIASSLLNQNASFLIDAVFAGEKNAMRQMTKRGILLNESEYEQARSFYASISRQAAPKGRFSKREVLGIYLDIVSENMPALKKIKKRKLKKMPMRELARMTTGFQMAEGTLMDLAPKEWIRRKEVKPESVLKFFDQFREIAARLGASKGDNAVRIKHRG
ncbi:MAG TPA: hypothetical protein VFR70_03805, partial [Flavobacterium sp.]|nr:hypothetical protein [Flavobacterium sp.]